MLTIDVLRPVLRAAWGPDTCDPHDLPDWRPDNPARGQCGVTALVVHDLLGGDLILGEVLVDGAKVGHHYWNRLPDGSEADLTPSSSTPVRWSPAARLSSGPRTPRAGAASSTRR